MNSQPSKRSPSINCLLLLLCLQTSSALGTGSGSQEPQSTSTEKPSDRQTAATDAPPEVVHSLAKLHELQLSGSYNSYTVDLEAKLIFAAPYWGVFFVQDGIQHAMISCTEATSWALVEQKVGCRIRINGVAGRIPSQINLFSFEVVDPSASIEPTLVATLATNQTLPLNQLVEVSSEVSEIFVSRHGTTMFAQVGSVPVDLDINEPMEINELIQYHTQTTIAQGCLSLPPDPICGSAYLIRIMNKGQVRTRPSDVPDAPAAKQFTVHEGRVLYTDSRSEFVVDTGGRVRIVQSHFAYRLTPGDKVHIHELASVKGNVASKIESSLIDVDSNEPLTGGKSSSVAELLTIPKVPNRVTLTAKLDSSAVLALRTDGAHKLT